MKSFYNFLISESRLDSSLKSKANAALRKAGFDGNGRFHSKSGAIGAFAQTIRPLGLDIEMQSLDLFLGAQGTRRINLVDQSGVEFSNSLVSFSWHKKDSGYEIVAYLS